ncbi:MAG: hypothetical protein RLZ98_1929 [Pseudomonadota bacterium]
MGIGKWLGGFCVAAGLVLVAGQAAAAPLGGATVAAQGANPSAAVPVHGRHCNYRRGHRHASACKRRGRAYYHSDEEYGAPRYFGGIEIRRRGTRGDYPEYPRWADRTFTEADDRGSP